MTWKQLAIKLSNTFVDCLLIYFCHHVSFDSGFLLFFFVEEVMHCHVKVCGWGCIRVKVMWRNERLMIAEFLHGVTQSQWTPWPTSPSPPLFLSWPHTHFSLSHPLSVLSPLLLICLNLSVELPTPPPLPLSHYLSLSLSLSPPCPPPLHPPMLFRCCCLSLSNNCTPVRAQWVLLQTHPGKHTHTRAHSQTHTHVCACTNTSTLTHTHRV